MKIAKTVLQVIGAILVLAYVVLMFYDFFAQFFVDTAPPDCAYTNIGCQGDNRWGQ